jgi:hypothetical protein
MRVIGYGIIKGENIECTDYEVQMNRLNQIIPNTPVKIKDKQGNWHTTDDREVYLYK